jgi:hypothetical protein
MFPEFDCSRCSWRNGLDGWVGHAVAISNLVAHRVGAIRSRLHPRFEQSKELVGTVDFP